MIELVDCMYHGPHLGQRNGIVDSELGLGPGVLRSIPSSGKTLVGFRFPMIN